MLLSRETHRPALALPGGRKGLERCDMGIAIVGTLVVPRLPGLSSNRPPQHMQNLVSLIPAVEQSRGRLPYLRRRVIPQLRGHDPVHEQVKARVDRAIRAVEFPDARFQRLLELGMLGAYHDRPHVLVSEVLKPELQLSHHSRIGNELMTCPLVLVRRPA